MAKRPKQPVKADSTPSLFHDAPTHAAMDKVDALESKADVEKALIPRDFPPSWVAALGEEFAKPYYAELRKFVAEERKQHQILPDGADVMNAFRATPLTQVRAVILGQDPYPTPGHAHGLCFSVRRGVAIPASLRNIYKELQDDLGIPPAKHGNLQAWAGQGVFLLNTVLTVRAGSPNSHKGKGWEEFTDAALAAVNKLDRKVVFLLWGAHAKQKAKLIDPKRHAVITGVHPSPMSADNGFFGSKPFSQVNEALEDAGLPPINWALPEV